MSFSHFLDSVKIWLQLSYHGLLLSAFTRNLWEICCLSATDTNNCKGKVMVTVTSIFIARLRRSDMVHTVLPANNTISTFTRKHSPGGATTHIRIANAWVQLTAHLSTPRGWMAELIYPEEVTRQLHVMAPARESWPVIDRHSNHCATPPMTMMMMMMMTL